MNRFYKYLLSGFGIFIFSAVALAESRTPISDVTHITVSGSYFLTNNIVADAYSSGIYVDVSDVTIDLNGFTISHTGPQFGADGIQIGAARNIEIANGTVTRFTRHGIFVIGDGSATPADIRLRNLRIVENGSGGIIIQPPGFLLENSTVSRNSGVGVSAQNAGLLNNNVISGNKYGLVAYVSGVGFLSNTLFSNGVNLSGSPTNLGRNLCGSTLCP